MIIVRPKNKIIIMGIVISNIFQYRETYTHFSRL